MTDPTSAPEMAGWVAEREWSDEFGDHYEARAIGRDGKLYSQHVMRYRYGWGSERGEAYENVRRAALAASPAPPTNRGKHPRVPVSPRCG